MDLTIISTIILPIVGILKAIQYVILKKCDTYLDAEGLNYKTIKRSSLTSAYIDTINTYRSIRYLAKKQIKEEDVSYLEKKWNDFSLEKTEDIKDLHDVVEDLIDRFGGRPENIFRSTDDWEDHFRESNDKLYRGMSHIYELKSIKSKRDTLDCIFWILFFMSLGVFLTIIALEVAKIDYSLFSFNSTVISFVIGILLLLSLIAVLIRFILIIKKLARVYKDATKYTI